MVDRQLTIAGTEDLRERARRARLAASRRRELAARSGVRLPWSGRYVTVLVDGSLRWHRCGVCSRSLDGPGAPPALADGSCCEAADAEALLAAALAADRRRWLAREASARQDAEASSRWTALQAALRAGPQGTLPPRR